MNISLKLSGTGRAACLALLMGAPVAGPAAATFSILGSAEIELISTAGDEKPVIGATPIVDSIGETLVQIDPMLGPNGFFESFDARLEGVAQGPGSSFAEASALLDVDILPPGSTINQLLLRVPYNFDFGTSVVDAAIDDALARIDISILLGDIVLDSVSLLALNGEADFATDALEADLTGAVLDGQPVTVSFELFGSASRVDVAAVPEPLTALLLPTALLCLGASRMRRLANGLVQGRQRRHEHRTDSPSLCRQLRVSA